MLGVAPISDEFIMMTAQEAFQKQHKGDQMHRINTEWATKKTNGSVNGTNMYTHFQEHYRTHLLILHQNATVDGQAHHTSMIEDRLDAVVSNLHHMEDTVDTLVSERGYQASEMSVAPSSIHSTTPSLHEQGMQQQIAALTTAVAQQQAMNQQFQQAMLSTGTRPPTERPPHRTTPQRNTPPSNGHTRPWRQWKYWCYTCGANLTHNSNGICKRIPKAANHEAHPTASFADPQGGNTARNKLWMQWCNPETHKPHPTPNS